MKPGLASSILIARAPRRREASRAVAAFTMVEIAISLAVIGIALIAISGVLPMGMNVQQENRQETIVDQDASYWMDAIRSGAHGLYDLTNYVESIMVSNAFSGGYTTNTYPTANYPYNNWNDGFDPQVNYGPQVIVGLLSTPKYVATNLPGGFITNTTTANVLAISGNASEKPPQKDSNIRDLAFAYRLTSEVVPFRGFDTNATNFGSANLSADEMMTRSNYCVLVNNLQTNLYEVRLTFRYPLFPNGRVGNGRQTFRTLVSSTLMASNGLYFFQPHDFAKAP